MWTNNDMLIKYWKKPFYSLFFNMLQELNFP